MLPEPMDNLSLTDEKVRTAVVERLRGALNLKADGYRVNTDMLLDALAYAAATGMSLHGVCEEVDGFADDTTMRPYLEDAINAVELADLEERLSAALTIDLPSRLLGGSWDIAIDLHDQPFYGKDARLRRFACRGQAKSGTTRCFRIATAYVMHHGVRFTVALAFVLPQDDLSDVLAVLIQRVKAAGITIRTLWLDRGFASVNVMRTIVDEKHSAVIACPIRGTSGGTRALCKGRATYTTDYRFHSAEHGDFTARVAVVRTKGRHGKFIWCLYILINTPLEAHKAHAHYRHRFGIESSYRQMRQVRIRTSSANPAWRFLAMATGFILLNVWTALRFLFCQIPRRAGRILDEGRFRLRRLAAFIRHAIEHRYHTVDFIHATALPLTS